MRLLGVDLASQPANTSAALLEAGRVVELWSCVDDDLIVTMATGCDAVGIDAPLGWPDDFVAAITAHHGGQPVPSAEPRALQLRHTDRFVQKQTRKQPLSVSTDRIGVVALRAIRLLERLAGPGADRSGAAGIFETYPGGAVAAWSLVERSYKRKDSEPERAVITEALAVHLDLGPFRDQMIDSDDDLDAVLCALLAGLSIRGYTHRPAENEQERAQREGWIHIPTGPISDLDRLR